MSILWRRMLLYIRLKQTSSRVPRRVTYEDIHPVPINVGQTVDSSRCRRPSVMYIPLDCSGLHSAILILLGVREVLKRELKSRSTIWTSLDVCEASQRWLELRSTSSTLVRAPLDNFGNSKST